MKRLNDLIRLLGMVALAAALYQELRKPPEERTWQGSVAGFVPYDFRVPTLERVKERLWNPQDRRVLVPMVFGVGWSINFASLYDWLHTFYMGCCGGRAQAR